MEKWSNLELFWAWIGYQVWIAYGLDVFWYLKGVKHVLKSGEIKVEALKARNYKKKEESELERNIILFYLILYYPILSNIILSYLQLQGGILIPFQLFLPDS